MENYITLKAELLSIKKNGIIPDVIYDYIEFYENETNQLSKNKNGKNNKCVDKLCKDLKKLVVKNINDVRKECKIPDEIELLINFNGLD